MINYLYPILFIFSVLYLWRVYFNLRSLEDDFLEKNINNINLIKSFIKSYSSILLKSFIFFLLFVISFILVRKDFGFLLIYGFSLFVIYLFFEIILLYGISMFSNAFHSDRLVYNLKSAFIIFKFLNLLLVVFFLHSFYLKAGLNYDYPIIVFSPLIIVCAFNIISNTDDNSFLPFINNLVVSFVFLTLISFGFKYVPSYMPYLVLLWGFFVFFVLLEQFFSRYEFSFKNIFLKKFLVFILYSFLVIFFVYKSFNLNLFVFLVFLFNFLLLIFIFELKQNFEKNLKILLFVFFIFLLLVSRFLYTFVVGITYEKMIILMILLLFPMVYYYLIKDQYFIVENIFMKEKKFSFDLNFSFKTISFFLAILSYFSFKIAYDYMSIYYGYTDSFNFTSIIIPFLFFYLIENYSFLIRKLGNAFLDLIFNISVIVFSYSAQIVVLSYLFGLNYINLVSIFSVYFLLTFLYSSKIIHHFISMLYLISIYIIIYV